MLIGYYFPGSEAFKSNKNDECRVTSAGCSVIRTAQAV